MVQPIHHSVVNRKVNMQVDEVHAIVFVGHRFSAVTDTVNPVEYANLYLDKEDYWKELQTYKRLEFIRAYEKEHKNEKIPNEKSKECMDKAKQFVEDAKVNKKEKMAQEIAKRIKNCKTPADLPATVQDGFHFLDSFGPNQAGSQSLAYSRTRR